MPLLKEHRADQLRVQVYQTREEMGRAAGEAVLCILRGLLQEKEEVNVIFAAAPSQNEMLDTLVGARDVAWDRVNAFHMDEYVGLSSDAPQGFGNFLTAHLFGKLPFKCVFKINSAADDPKAECNRYAELLQEYPVDLVCLGIGENAHIAFNDPGVAKFQDSALAKLAQLDLVCRTQQVHDGCFPALSDVPTQAITLTVPALTAAKHMVCTVPAATKRQAVALTVLGPVTEDVPASIMQQHPGAVMFCDADSGADLL